MRLPERLLVGHPFNPVYLLPLVELVGGEKTSLDTINRASAFYQAVGMHPLHVKKEIPAFIADRFLEAVWREALWLVNPGIASTEEIDDAIRFGCIISPVVSDDETCGGKASCERSEGL